MQEETKEKSKETEHREDGYVNLMNKYGSKDDASEQYHFESGEPVTDIELTLNYEENGLFSKIIDIPADEAVSSGFSYGVTENIEKFINKSLEKLDFEEKAGTAIKWSRLYGGALMVMLIDDGKDLDEPVDWDNIHGIDELIVFERPIVTPDYSSLYSYKPNEKYPSKFGMPEYYDISPIYGSAFRVHESRCLLFKNGILPSMSTRTEYRFFGMPEYVRIYKTLQETVTSHGNGVKLLDRAVQAIYKMKELAQLLSTDQGEDKVIQRLRIIDMAKSIINSIAIDADGEDYDYKQITFSGVKDIIDSTCNMLSAVTNIPQTKLFGRSPAGENSTGESDMENYYKFVEKIQKLNLKNNMVTLIDIILIAGRYKKEFADIPDYSLEFNPLWSLSENEQATVEQMKAATEFTKAQTAQIYVDMQALDSSEIRQKLAESGEFTINDVLDEEDEDWGTLSELSSQESEETSNTALSAENKTTGISRTGEIVEDSVQPTGCGVIVMKGGKVLIGERKDNGLICGPGGHIEAGETPEDAAIRETREEFGINIANIVPLSIISDIPDEYCPSQIFLCTEYYGEPICFNPEMENARFEDVRNILKMRLFLPFELSVRELLDQLLVLNRDAKSSDDWVTINGQHIKVNEKGEQIGGNPNVFGNKKAETEQKSTKTEKSVDYETAKEYTKTIKGVKTVKGTEMKKVSVHAAARMKDRNISPSDVKDVLTGAGITYPGNKKHPDAECYQYKGMRMVVSPQGVLVTAIDLEDN